MEIEFDAFLQEGAFFIIPTIIYSWCICPAKCGSWTITLIRGNVSLAMKVAYDN